MHWLRFRLWEGWWSSVTSKVVEFLGFAFRWRICRKSAKLNKSDNLNLSPPVSSLHQSNPTRHADSRN